MTALEQTDMLSKAPSEWKPSDRLRFAPSKHSVRFADDVATSTQCYITALMGYLRLLDEGSLTRNLSKSGRNPDCLAWSDNQKYQRFSMPWVEGIDNPIVHRRERARPQQLKSLTKGTFRKAQRAAAKEKSEPRSLNANHNLGNSLAGSLGVSTAALAMEVVSETSGRPRDYTRDEVANRIQQIFDEYSVEDESNVRAPRMMTLKRFLKAVADLDLLDNAFTHLDAFLVFEEIRTDTKNAQAGLGSRLDAKDFRIAMYGIGDRKYPHIPEPSERRSKLMGQYLADSRVRCVDNANDELLARHCMEELAKLDGPFKKIFARYACLDIFDPHQLGWSRVKQAQRTLPDESLVLMLTNFDVVPHLVTRTEVEACVKQVRRQARKQGIRFCLTLPAVLDVLAQIAVLVESTAVQRLLAPGCTTNETRALRILISLVPLEFQEDCRKALAQRGRLFELDVAREGMFALPPKQTEEFYSSRTLNLDRAAEEQEAQEKESRALFHVHMRAMDIARLEDRRAERQMLESTSRQPVRGAGVTFGAPPGSFASRSSLVDVESSAHFTMSSLLALDGAMAGGRGAGEASWRSQHVPSKEEADKEALEAMREIRQFERAHMKRMENARRVRKISTDAERARSGVLTPDLTQLDLGPQRSFGQRHKSEWESAASRTSRRSPSKDELFTSRLGSQVSARG